ncbi:MAG: cytochrome c biogenesis protein CcsA [Polyangiales bacterium]
MSEPAPSLRQRLYRPFRMVLPVLTLGSVAAFLYVVFMETPMEEQMGIVQKIFYLHVPSANGMYLGWTLAAVGGLGYLATRKDSWDALAVAGAEVGTLFCLIVLITGPLWGRKAWGTYWVWDPRLTSTLLAGLVYMAFLSLRAGNPGATEKRFAATLAMLGFPLMFLIKFSVQAWSGQHPVVMSANGGGIAPAMYPALILGFVSLGFLALWLLDARFTAERTSQEAQRLELLVAERGWMENQ